MTSKRTYGERCGIATALDLVGERWALLVVRELVLGPKRFTDLQAGLAGAGANVLAQRLHDLEAVGVIRRAKLPPPAGSRVYELTEWGSQLGPILLALARWGSSSPVVPPRGSVGPDSLLLGLRGSFDGDAAGDLRARYEFRLGEDVYAADVADGRLEIARGASPDPAAIVETDRETFADLLDGAASVRGLMGGGRLTVHGDVEAVGRLFAALWPPRAGPPA